jgi:hypothetical protein
MATLHVAPAVGALALSVLLILVYVLYQLLGYRRLRRVYGHLCELKTSQRQAGRRAEVLQRRGASLANLTPLTVRPAPYAEGDTQAMALRNDLGTRLEALRVLVRPLETGPQPVLRASHLLTHRYWLQLRKVEEEVAAGERQLQDLARAEAVVDELDRVLAALARKPLEVQRGLADVQALATALVQDIQQEEERGTGGMAPLAFDVQAVRSSAQESMERLRTARTPDAPSLAIEAEGLRRNLLSKLADVQSRAEGISDVHDRALTGQERLEKLLQAVQKQIAGLRPALVSSLQPQLAPLQQAQQTLALRYLRHDPESYQAVAQDALANLAQAHSLSQHVQRLAEADGRAMTQVQACREAFAEVQGLVEQEQGRSPTRLDVTLPAMQCFQTAIGQLQSLWEQGVEALAIDDPAAITTLLGQVEALVGLCRQEEGVTRTALSAWQAERARIRQVADQIEGTGAAHERLAQAWHGLQRYARANWSGLPADWFEYYMRQRNGLLAEAAQVRAALDSGQVSEANVGPVVQRCEDMAARWQALLQEGERVVEALGRVQTLERQAVEGVSELRPAVLATLRLEPELKADVSSGPDLCRMASDILASFRDLEDRSRRPGTTDLAQLCGRDLPALQEQLADHKQSYVRLLERERAALKRQLLLAWEQWEPLRQRLMKAVPTSDIDAHDLEKRWGALMHAARQPLTGLAAALDLKAQTGQLTQDVAAAQERFDIERRLVREAEQALAQERRTASLLHEIVPNLLNHAHPQVVDEEWERSTRAWRKSESLLRQLEPRKGIQAYMAAVTEATTQYQESHVRARSALSRLLRHGFLEDPEGMNEVCRPLGARWGHLGLTAREEHIQELLGEAERSGNLARLAERVELHWARPGRS